MGESLASDSLLDIVCSHFRRVSEDLFQSFLEPINVVVDQVLPMNFTLVDEADECEALVHFPQVQNDVLLIVCVRQSDNR